MATEHRRGLDGTLSRQTDHARKGQVARQAPQVRDLRLVPRHPGIWWLLWEMQEHVLQHGDAQGG